MKKIITVFGTRPEIIKLSPLFKLLDKNFNHIMVNTSQHYSPSLSKNIKADLKVRKADYNLPAIELSFTKQMIGLIPKLEKIYRKEKPDYVLVQGDTNSGLLGALVAARESIPVIHVEAGCRSGNLKAPEEQNRRMIDSIASIFFAADKVSYRNLLNEGVKNVFLVGNTGLDAVAYGLAEVKSNPKWLDQPYAIFTLHRMENTIHESVLREKLAIATYVSKYLKVIFPAHPRTLAAIKRFKIRIDKNIEVLAPQPYLDFIHALRDCRFVMSDSGGVQEEAALINRPCVVLRDETEWTRLIKAKKNFLLPKLGNKEKKLLLQIIQNENFYKKIKKRKAPEIKAGASKSIISHIRKLE